MWNLDDASIAFGVRLDNSQTLRAGEQVFISYGPAANSYLLTEYGFCLPQNKYDFFRTTYRMNQFNGTGLKSEIRADLKARYLNRDVLKMIRSENHPDLGKRLCREIEVLKSYREWLVSLQQEFV